MCSYGCRRVPPAVRPGVRWDQDENACINLLGRFGALAPEESSEPESKKGRWARRKEKKAEAAEATA